MSGWCIVTPVPKDKEEDKSHPKANRPITNTPAFGKLFEFIMKNRMVNFLDMKNWIADTQHGFRTGEGCEELLL